MAKEDVRAVDPESASKSPEVPEPQKDSSEIAPSQEVVSDVQASPETLNPPEQSKESEAPTEQGSAITDKPREDRFRAIRRKKKPSVTATPKQIDDLEEEIEDILEEELEEIYKSLPPDKQKEFKEKGEETRSKIRVAVSSAKVNAKKIFSLIRAWLKIIPGVNRFFLEQEAKIKTDKILLVTEEEKKHSQNDLL